MADKKGFKAAGADLFFSSTTDAPKAAETIEEAKPPETIQAEISLEGIKNGGRNGGNVTFYLENNVQEALTAKAKEMKVSKSKLVNGILERVLMGQYNI